jgi:hypothetical protein
VTDILVWKCRPGWLALSRSERTALLQELSMALYQSRMPSHHDLGPYMVHHKDSCLMVFGKAREGTAELERTLANLAGYFEPLAIVGRRSPFTPRTLADRLQKSSQ